ncbi:MAG: GAF domain-containing protein [Anaerolineales bacterium]|nr:GAF domain-containing protein [Anaerolineales bacterium]
MFKFNKGSIRKRLLIGFVLIGFIPVFAASIGTVIILERIGQNQTRERLEAVASSKETEIKSWTRSVQEELLIITYSDQAHDRIATALDIAVGRTADNSAIIWYNKIVRSRLNGFVESSPQLIELFIVNSLGQVWLSTDPEQEGLNVNDEVYFQQGMGQPYFYLPSYGQGEYSPSLTSRSAIMTIPIAGLEGHVVGVLCGRVRLDELEQILDEPTGLGTSGKAYLVNTDRSLIVGSSEIRAQDEVELQSFASSLAATVSFDGRENGWDAYDDFRGERVIGIYRWLPEQPVALFVEQNQSEALAVILPVLGIHVAIALAALLLAIGLSLIVRRGIAGPLESLAKTATRISMGDLQLTASVEHDDEVGILAQAFNRMTGQLRALIADLERRVEERTSDLRRLALRLETSVRVSREISSILDLDELLSKVTDLIRTAFGYYAVNIFLMDAERGVLEYRGIQSGSHKLTVGPGSLNGIVAENNHVLLVNDVSQDSRYQADPNLPDTRSELIAPMRVGNRIIGTLDLQSTQINAFREEDVPVAQGLADQLAIAIENAHLYERSRDLAVLEERNRMARELHDSMNQALFSVVLFAGAGLEEAEKAGQKSIQRYLARIERMAHQALKEMRLMIFEMRPIVLEQRGLVGALEQRLMTVEEKAGIDVNLTTEGDLALPPEQEEAIYRIIQEALNNSLKHAAATEATVSIISNNDRIDVTVADNGIGFDQEKQAHKGTVGLISIRERAEALGAVLQVESELGKGTCVRLSLDCKTSTKQSPEKERSS